VIEVFISPLEAKFDTQRAILNFTPGGELGPQGGNLSPRGEVHPFVHPQG
jgi:hypothetical protein